MPSFPADEFSGAIMTSVKVLAFAATALLSTQVAAQSLNNQTINGHISITGADDNGSYTINVLNGPITIGSSGYSQTFNVFRQLTEGGFSTASNQINGTVTLNISGSNISVNMNGQVQPFELTNDFSNIADLITNASFSSTGLMTGVNMDLGGSHTSNSVNFSTYYLGFQPGTNVTQTAALRLSAVTGAVPEPATWAMMLLGFAGIGVAMRRGQKSARLPQVA